MVGGRWWVLCTYRQSVAACLASHLVTSACTWTTRTFQTAPLPMPGCVTAAAQAGAEPAHLLQRVDVCIPLCLCLYI